VRMLMRELLWERGLGGRDTRNKNKNP